jgi:diguanylate cyclase (GGDEF)-like protein/PAS domain S-box-containing protein
LSHNTEPISLEELARLADVIPVMLACFDTRTKQCLYANAQFAALGPLNSTESIGKSLFDIAGDDVSTRMLPMIDRVVAENATVTYSRSMQKPDGSPCWVEVCLLPSGALSVNHVFVMISDISRHRLAELDSQKSSERLRKFMAASAEGIVFHVNGTITDVNPPMLRMLGYTNDEMVGHQTLEFVPMAERARVQHVLQDGGDVTYESLVQKQDGRSLPVEFSARDFDWSGKKQRLIIVRDISERRAAEERIRFLALHDSLTGLPNRAQLDDLLSTLIDEANVTHSTFAIFFIDLDQLKRVNDSLGHTFGDMLLTGVAERLRELCDKAGSTHEKAWLARLGGDEFVIVLRSAARAQCEEFSHALQSSLKLPIDTAGRKIRVTASVGVALFPHDADTPSGLLKNADAAMYLAKAAGRDATRFFDPSIAEAADNALRIEGELDHALRNQEFELYYQPQVSADGRKIVGVEALIRWHHSSRGLLSPDEFIPIAEGLHLILPMGQWVVDTALAQVPRWRALGWSNARVSVNLSTQQFRAPGFADSVLASLAKLNLGGDCLELEVTERMLMSDDATLQTKLKRLRQARITLAIDDFGTGFSSLSRLRELPIEKLKIDRSFVIELPGTHSARAIVNSILELARGLSLSVVAEGVETVEQRDSLAALGCASMQGYLFARPMSGEAFAEWLKTLLANHSGVAETSSAVAR